MPASPQPPWQLLHGDAGLLVPLLPAETFDALVTDPPGGIGFMGLSWDGDRGGRDAWIVWLAGILRAARSTLKPGAHALIWALPRTSHWTALAIEAAGFELRDCCYHVFGKGLPKSRDISKAIDQYLGVDRPITSPGTSTCKYLARGIACRGHDNGTLRPTIHSPGTAPGSSEAATWSGWGTALKPAVECWWLARNPFATTVVANVLTHGTGALNIDGCRLPTEDRLTRTLKPNSYAPGGWKSVKRSPVCGKEGGRWPTNLALSHDERCADNACVSECPAAMLDAQRPEASRFFYCVKVAPGERATGGALNDHPTLKPIALMQWLCRLVTPPGGTVLDPFAGSGTTGVACAREGFRFVGIERDVRHARTATLRIRTAYDT
jgi:site-specific DNA-methyltransferase (adenine-specific)